MVKKIKVNGNITSFECFDDRGHLISLGAEIRPLLFSRLPLEGNSLPVTCQKKSRKEG